MNLDVFYCCYSYFFNVTKFPCHISGTLQVWGWMWVLDSSFSRNVVKLHAVSMHRYVKIRQMLEQYQVSQEFPHLQENDFIFKLFGYIKYVSADIYCVRCTIQCNLNEMLLKEWHTSLRQFYIPWNITERLQLSEKFISPLLRLHFSTFFYVSNKKQAPESGKNILESSFIFQFWRKHGLTLTQMSYFLVSTTKNPPKL